MQKIILMLGLLLFGSLNIKGQTTELASDQSNVSWSQIQGIPSEIADGTDATCTETQVDGFVANNGYLTAETPQTLSLASGQLSISGGNTVTLPLGTDAQTLTYTPATGALAIANGNTVTILPTLQTSSVATNQASIVVTSANVPGLSFAVTAGRKYEFTAYINYNAAATTTGIRLNVTAPNNTWYAMTVNSTTTATQEAMRFNSATQFVSTASSVTTGNVGIIRGHCIPSANGTVQVQFASELAGSAITVLAGSTIVWQEFQ